MNVRNELVKKLTNKNSSLRIDKFIKQCLHEKNSYYIDHNPLGKDYDFVTAPEISQMFGEIIGLYILNYWLTKIGSRFNLIELGPGKGTLLNDILRVSKINNQFIKNAKITLIDKNIKLIKLQKKVINSLDIKKVKWKEKFHLNSSLPSIVYSNEFFDCFAIRQFYKKKYWLEKFVKYNFNEDQFSLFDKIVTEKKIKKELLKYNKYGVAEISIEREKIFKYLCRHINKNKGMIITVDYGYNEILKNFSLQTVFRHKKTHLFDNIGKQDITSLVNFNEFITIAKQNNLKIDLYSSQKKFLNKYGINKRKNSLKVNQTLIKKKIIENQYKVLTDNKYMGNKFKVLIVSSK